MWHLAQTEAVLRNSVAFLLLFFRLFISLSRPLSAFSALLLSLILFPLNLEHYRSPSIDVYLCYDSFFIADEFV